MFPVNQSNANVSVVRYGQTDEDVENNSMTLTLDPPPYVPPDTNASVNANNVDAEPSIYLSPEDSQTLKSALQTEEAIQILGDNVAAMLGKRSITNDMQEN